MMTGMGEGEGRKDVSDQIENEEQLLGLKDDKPPDESQSGDTCYTVTHAIITHPIMTHPITHPLIAHLLTHLLSTY